jgi:hypothetical protein
MSTLSPRARGATEGTNNLGRKQRAVCTSHARGDNVDKLQDARECPDRQAKTFVVERKGRLLFLGAGARIITGRRAGCADQSRGRHYASPLAAAPF